MNSNVGRVWARRFLLMLVGLAFGVGLLRPAMSGAQEESGTKAGSRAGAKTVSAGELIRLERKLDQILAKQEELSQRLNEQHAKVMEELRIVKVRSLIGTGGS